MKLEESERKRKFKEDELVDLTEHIDDLKASNEYLLNSKIKLETDRNLISVSDFYSSYNFKQQSFYFRLIWRIKAIFSGQ